MAASGTQAGQKNSSGQTIKTAVSGGQNGSGESLADICVLNESGTGLADVTVVQPPAGENVEIVIEPGRTYVFDFAGNGVQDVVQDGGNVRIAFTDGASVTLVNFADGVKADVPASLTFTESLAEGKLAALVDLIESTPPLEELEAAGKGPQSGVRGEELTQAEKLAQIEPAAGEGASGRPSNSGFGFQSTVDLEDIAPLHDVGPIDPTALLYGIPSVRDDIYVQEDASAPQGSQTVPLHPVLAVQDQQVYEDGSIGVSLYAAPESANGALTIVISGIPATWSVSGPGVYDPSTGTWTITTVAGDDFSGGPVLTPPADSDADLPGLNVEVTETDSVTGETGTTSGGFDIIVDAVADDPSIDAQDDSGDEGATLNIDITALTGEAVHHGAGADDGSEIITGYRISGVPAGFTLSAGTEVSPGVYDFTPAEIIGLTMTPDDPNFSGALDLTATVFTSENPADGEFDTGNNDNQASDLFTLTWAPVIHPPSILVNGGLDDALVKEDGTVDVPITAALGENPAANEFLTVTITGIDPAWGAFSAPVGTYDSSTGTWTVVLAPGESLDTVLTFAPAADSDIDLSGLTATAVSTDPDAALSASTDDSFNVLVDAVADVPDLSAGDVSGEEGTTIPLSITTAVTDTDGSEVIELVKIGNLPTGATLTAGTFDSVENVWIVSPADLSGLGIVIPDGVTGDFTLSVESVSYEQNTHGAETDLTDNRASAFDTIALHIDSDAKPVLKPESADVDESDLSPTTSVSDTVEADFGNDGPGSFKGNGTYDIGGLTSGGVAVTVLFDITTNSYTGIAGTETVFTLVIQSNGDYTFTLLKPVDHPVAGDEASGAHDDSLPLEFGVIAIDSEDDATAGTITINVFDDGPDALDDLAHIAQSADSVSGNVLDNDDLSRDVPNSVEKISFGSDIYDVPETGSIVIYGQYGTLEISADGSYTYTRFAAAGAGGTASLDPVSADVVGVQSSLTKDGITVAIANTGNFDLSWVVTGDGEGIGIDNLDTGDSQKAWPKGETFDISFAQDAQEVTITISDLGSNNNDGRFGADYTVTLADGSTVTGEQQFVPSQIVNGSFSFTLDSADFGGQLISSVALSSTDSGCYLGASFLLGNVEVTYPPSCDCGTDEFTYTLTDGDGDYDTAVLTIECAEDRLIVGQNVDDIDGSQTPHIVGGDDGAILGGFGADILVGDAGGSFTQQQTQDYNFVFILDVSGSMGNNNDPNSQINILKDAVQGLMNEFSTYNNGEIMVHIVPFSTNAQPSGTFVLTDAGDLADVTAYLDALVSGGWTNYEDPMQEAIAWLQSGAPLDGDAITTTYFISDGEPNRYMTASGWVASGSDSVAMGQVTGADGSDEVGLLQSLSDKVIAIGIDTDASISNLNLIDSGGAAENITDPSQLGAVLAGSNPVNNLLAVGGDDIQGGEGDDIIFGDVLYTDGLAGLHGLSVYAGAGWEVFERLEAGESTLNPGWSRADTVDYIRANAETLAMESMSAGGETRSGGDDTIYGGAGDDLIFGQEGDDVIAGGSGDDTIYGGSGADMFLFGALNEGVDTVKDFNAGEGDRLDLSAILTGYDPLGDDIADFIIATEAGGNTLIAVDAAGTGDALAAVSLVVLEGVTGLDLDLAVKTDSSVV